MSDIIQIPAGELCWNFIGWEFESLGVMYKIESITHDPRAVRIYLVAGFGTSGKISSYSHTDYVILRPPVDGGVTP